MSTPRAPRPSLEERTFFCLRDRRKYDSGEGDSFFRRTAMQCPDLEVAPTPARCAIYARKSFQPPRGQEVTSIETQRAICSSYITSQQHKGWIEFPKRYEDSGQSGAR